MKYLLDTNILSEPMRLDPDSSVMRRLNRHRTALVTASVVWHELNYGCERLPLSNKRSRLASYLAEVVQISIPIFPYDERAAAWHAQARARLAAKGVTTSHADGQIAAIAIVNKLILVTRNTRDFDCFAGIKLENWFERRAKSGKESLTRSSPRSSG